jgi:predicted RNase H-like HicB family nuclease
MTDYHINIFYSDEDSCYVADIPDLTYCSVRQDAGRSARRGADR